MPEFFTIADDMTGAIEVGAHFAQRGVTAAVTAATDLEAAELAQATVLVVGSESRHISPAAAAQRVAQLADFARRQGFKYIYKKTDSTLRGNIAAELGALLAVFPDQPLVYVPAYPKLGRTCKAGHLYVHGKLLEETGFANDPLNPITRSYIPDVLQQCNVPVRLAADSVELERLLQQDGIIVCDCETDADLQEIAHLLQRHNKLQLIAGPSGFIEYLAPLLDLPKSAMPAYPKLTSTLTICGSVNEVSLAQARHGDEHGFAVMKLTPKHILEQTDTASLVDEVLVWLADQKHLVLRLVDNTDELAHYLQHAQRLGMEKSAAHELVVEQLGRLVRAIIAQTDETALVVFGGDTAVGVLQQAVIWPVGELLAGVPISRVTLAGWELWLITKSGGFGPVDVLPQVKELLSGR